MLELAGLNWLAIVVVTALSFALGGLWYGPLFAQSWMTALGKKREDLAGNNAVPYVLSAVTALLTSIVLAILVKSTGISDIGGGLVLGVLVGIGVIAASMASDYAFSGWSTTLYLITAGYRVVYTVLMSLILAIWR